jgi:hypothetical protein
VRPLLLLLLPDEEGLSLPPLLLSEFPITCVCVRVDVVWMRDTMVVVRSLFMLSRSNPLRQRNGIPQRFRVKLARFYLLRHFFASTGGSLTP